MLSEWGKVTITMGASKEGTMSVREMLNNVFRTRAEEDGVNVATEREGNGNLTSDSSSPDEMLFHKLTLFQLKQMIQHKLMLIKSLGDSLNSVETECKFIKQDRDEFKQNLAKAQEHNSVLELRNEELHEENKRHQVTICDQKTEIFKLRARLKLESARATNQPKPLTSPTYLSKQFIQDNLTTDLTTYSVLGKLVHSIPLRNDYKDRITHFFPHGRPESPPQLSPTMLTSFNSTSQVKSFMGVVDGHDSKDFDNELVSLSNNHKRIEPLRFPYLAQSSREKSPFPQTTKFNSTFFDQHSTKPESFTNNNQAKEQRLEHNTSPHLPSSRLKLPLESSILDFDPKPDTEYSCAKRMRLTEPSTDLEEKNTTSSGITFRSFTKSFGANDIRCQNTTNTSPGTGHVPPLTNKRNRFFNPTRPIPKKISPSLPLSKSPIGFPNVDLSNSLMEFENSNDIGRQASELNFSPNYVKKPSKVGVAMVKRKVGRPPKLSLSKSCFPSTSVSKKSPKAPPPPMPSVSSPLTFQPNVTNLVVNEQRFSQRGRLLKPNRMRYSPEPDVVLGVKEKLPNRRSVVHMLLEGKESAATPAGGVEEEKEEELPPPKPVEVPRFRETDFDGWKEGEERTLPDDDMSEEAFVKRHLKYEVKEKQRKRWDSQRLREETYNDMLRQNQNQRKRLKEMRNVNVRKGKLGCNSDEEQEKLVPQLEDIKAVYISRELPAGAFGYSLPFIETEEFHLSWKPKLCREIHRRDKEKSSKLISPLNKPLASEGEMDKRANCAIASVSMEVKSSGNRDKATTTTVADSSHDTITTEGSA